MGKRILLFLTVNFLVIITLSIVLNFLNVQPYLDSYGIHYRDLMIFCLVWGMGGAFISLGISRMMAKWLMGVKVIPMDTRDAKLQNLLQTIEKLIRKAGLSDMPEVGIYNSPEMNAFATGPTKRRSLVAVSSGLLDKMSQVELEGVLAHEISHIANGDMVTMTLLQGVVNAFVMFLARVLAYFVSTLMRSRDSQGSIGMSYYLMVFIFEIFFMILGSIVVAWFSRFREYRADRGGADLAGREKMIMALQALQRSVQVKEMHPSMAAMKISTPKKGGLWSLLASHPSLEDRIQRLKF